MNISLPALLVIGGALITIILVLFWHPQPSRSKADTSATRYSTGAIFRDDERYWYGGIFYNNPDDPAMFVPKRFGFGWTMNFGHPQAKLVLVAILLALLLFGVILPVLVSGTAPNGCHMLGCHP